MKQKNAPDFYLLDLMVDCPNKSCLVKAGKACKGLSGYTTHFGRRVKRLLKERK